MAEAVLHDVDAHVAVHDDVDPIDHRPPLILGAPDFHAITEAVARPIEWKAPLGWWIVLGISLAMLSLLGVAVGWLFWEGIGVWGNQIPVAWAWDITNFVFWVGIGHAGTLISAVLFLVRQRWRTSINRAAEAMTLFAVACALLFPTIHTGRPWLDYWMMPVPNQMAMWPQFRSPLMWDVFAVSIYGTVSLIFWYVGLIPDLATMRDRSRHGSLAQKLNGLFALGWRGSHRQWHHYERAYLLLAGLATPLVLSVHSVVSFDFATAQLPGWHTTIFPPYFVAGAIFSGLAMVITLMVICRVAFKMEHIINLLHFDRMAKLILATGSIVGYAYATEFFVAWYSGNLYEFFAFRNRAMGPYAWAYWTMVTCNVVVPQLFWFKKARVHIPLLFVASIFINIGMWFERFVIIVTSLHRDFMPANWDYFHPTIWDISTLIGSFGLFFTLFTLFVRFLPMVAIAEVKGVLPQAHAQPHATPPSVPYRQEEGAPA
jgi:molybdopterin-containing oxidoreductase family membrane subunit